MLPALAVGAGSEGTFADDPEQPDHAACELHDLSDRGASSERTLDQARRLHFALSREMNREVEAVLALDRAGRAVESLTA